MVQIPASYSYIMINFPSKSSLYSAKPPTTANNSKDRQIAKRKIKKEKDAKTPKS